MMVPIVPPPPDSPKISSFSHPAKSDPAMPRAIVITQPCGSRVVPGMMAFAKIPETSPTIAHHKSPCIIHKTANRPGRLHHWDVWDVWDA